MNEIQLLWKAHEYAPFPPGISGLEIEGEDLVSLDTYTSGCISSFCGTGGRLDEGRIKTLTECHASLTKVLPMLTGYARDYYSRLHQMSQCVLEHLHRRNQ